MTGNNFSRTLALFFFFDDATRVLQTTIFLCVPLRGEWETCDLDSERARVRGAMAGWVGEERRWEFQMYVWLVIRNIDIYIYGDIDILYMCVCTIFISLSLL